MYYVFGVQTSLYHDSSKWWMNEVHLLDKVSLLSALILLILKQKKSLICMYQEKMIVT